MQSNKMTSSMGQPFLELVESWKNDYQVAVLALNSKSVPNMSVYELDHHFQEQRLGVGDVTTFLCILRSVSVNQSCGFSMVSGVWYLSHAMLVLAELIVCSIEGVNMHPSFDLQR